MKSIKVIDEALSGDILNEITLSFDKEYITVTELIENRVTTEIELYNKNINEYKYSLVKPSNLEERLNNKSRTEIDIEKQIYIALDAFQKNGFFIIVDDEQVESLEQKILVDSTASVSFMKLTPLVGG